ncbi:MAG: DUF262 domain-containing protein [Candidatus Thiosymbion ectosymbiont of Robbea hypermnestra]|nr:DUF262 domain-containing protein [Candidatus Thiosymbion ectosymbiont of Robbea hypermnestra]
MNDESMNLDQEENESFYEDDFERQPPEDVVAYNELRSCADLVRMYKEGTLVIQPDFQRDIVWEPAGQTRFIDSLIKQLPIPSMCFSLDYKSQNWQVIDGLQRMTAIIRFLTDKDWNLSKLDDIDQKISGVKVSAFMNGASDLDVYYKRVEDLTLPITVIRCNQSKNSHMEYLFTIFHRLNSGGTRLNNQEIRNCIFSGPFNTLLKELNEDQSWRSINLLEDKKINRYKHVEMILRFFAFHDEKDRYKGVLSKFLNTYMKENRKPPSETIEEKRKLFKRVVELIWEGIFDRKETRVGNSTLEALLYGVAKNIDELESSDKQLLRERFEKLRKNHSLSTDYLSGGVARKEKIDARLEAGRNIFQG